MKYILMVAAFAATSSLSAQGAVSLQGLGFPPGQMSTRAEGSGGSVVDFDALSLVNPASIGGAGSAALFFQYEPEFRKVEAGGGTAKTTTSRFPMIGAVIPMGSDWTLGVSSSTFLDRSYETRAERREQVGEVSDSVDLTERIRVLGAINDVRAALAWARTSTVRIGLAGHLFTGRNRVTLDQLFPDSTRFLNTSQESRVSYAGFAGSVGIEYRPSRILGIAVSARRGGDLRAQIGDTTVGTARLPDRVAAGVTYEGITGATISARLAHDGWSSLSPLSSSSVQAHDAWDASVGAEATGPRIMQRIISLRAGTRFRTLPFAFNGDKVSEMAFMAGFGAPLTRNRATLDFALQHASRSASGVKERGLILSFGLRVSP